MKDFRCSPLSGLKSFEGLAPAIVVAASADPLNDDARLYVKKLREANVSVNYFEVKGSHVGGLTFDHETRNAFLKEWARQMK